MMQNEVSGSEGSEVDDSSRGREEKGAMKTTLTTRMVVVVVRVEGGASADVGAFQRVMK